MLRLLESVLLVVTFLLHFCHFITAYCYTWLLSQMKVTSANLLEIMGQVNSSEGLLNLDNSPTDVPKREVFGLDGFCDEKFIPVKNHLEKMLKTGAEQNLQLCVYVGHKCVVDLYGTAVGNWKYNPDTLQPIFSSGKSIESIIMAMLYDKGLFNYEDKISQHWPKFGQHAKGDIKICDVLRHESGLAHFSESIPTIKNAWPENIKLNKIGQFIEKEKQHFPMISKTEYHALSRGLVINEIVRRLDPKERTMSEILRQDINIDGILLALRKDELHKFVPYKIMSATFILQQLLAPWWWGKKIDLTLNDIFKTMVFCLAQIPKIARTGYIPKIPKTFGELDNHSIFELFDRLNTNDFARSEVSSAGILANARGCAKLASIMANKGENLMSEKAWNTLHSKPKKAVFGDTPDGICRCNFTLGGVNYFKNFTDATLVESEKFNKNREGFYGWVGIGGSIMQWHPELQIGFAFMPTYYNLTDYTNVRGAVLQQIVKDCVMKHESENSS